MFSRTSEYALRAVAFLAKDPQSPQTALQTAQGTKVPLRYLSKVLQSLGKAGILRGQRGKNGGFTLARPTDRISMLDVINAIDPIQRIKHCPLGLPSHLNLCPLHRRLDQATEMIIQALGNSSIAEILAEKGGGVPLCDHAALRPVKARLTVRKTR